MADGDGVGIRSVFSQTPLQLVMCDLGGPISYGTGFRYRSGDRRYLVTNWHNLTGRNFLSNQLLNADARIPLWVEVRMATWLPTFDHLGQQHFTYLPHRVELYEDIASPFDAKWLEHQGGVRYDVVAIEDPVRSIEVEVMNRCVNDISYNNIPVAPGQLAFVIGYPQALSVGFGLPIWKSTFIASEPYYDIKIGGVPSPLGMVGGTSLPAFFLDGHTRGGMSGSPVFGQYSGMWDMENPYKEVDIVAALRSGTDKVALSGVGHAFLGIYSGRVEQAQNEAALGLCWRASVIDEICASGIITK